VTVGSVADALSTDHLAAGRASVVVGRERLTAYLLRRRRDAIAVGREALVADLLRRGRGAVAEGNAVLLSDRWRGLRRAAARRCPLCRADGIRVDAGVLRSDALACRLSLRGDRPSRQGGQKNCFLDHDACGSADELLQCSVSAIPRPSTARPTQRWPMAWNSHGRGSPSPVTQDSPFRRETRRPGAPTGTRPAARSCATRR
jgi:hypothetical protein